MYIVFGWQVQKLDHQTCGSSEDTDVSSLISLLSQGTDNLLIQVKYPFTDPNKRVSLG